MDGHLTLLDANLNELLIFRRAFRRRCSRIDRSVNGGALARAGSDWSSF